jgi:hypothetical protein
VVKVSAYTIELFTPIGRGECTAYVGLYSPAGRADRIVLLSTERPCEVGTIFEVEGARWRVDRELHGDAEGMWAAFQVEQ